MPCNDNETFIDGECVPWADVPDWLQDLISESEQDNTDVPGIINPKPEPSDFTWFNFNFKKLNITDKILGLAVFYIILSTKAWK